MLATFPELETAAVKAIAVESLLQGTAFHEAGHAVVLTVRGIPLRYASVTASLDDRGLINGRVQPDCAASTMSVETFLLWILAGAAAEGRHYPELRLFREELTHQNDWSDVEQALGVLTSLHAAPHTSAVVLDALARWRQLAERLVDQHWEWIVSVATELERWRRLTGDEVRRLRPASTRKKQAA